MGSMGLSMSRVGAGMALLAAMLAAASAYGSIKDTFFTDTLLREMASRMGHDMMDPSYFDLSDSSAMMRAHKDLDYELGQLGQLGEDNPPAPPSTRDGEYLQHSSLSSLWGHQYLSGGAGEGKQHLRPDGAIANVKQVKTDAALPAYCNPPNPCPVGYSAEDGCMESFENSAAFSRDFQAAQDCMCDQEHMFDCPRMGQTQGGGAGAGAESAGDLSDTDIDRFMKQFQQTDSAHNTLVAKKFHAKKSVNNPFLQGERLPVAAKKGYNVN